jgi:hypothetical protein
MYKSAQKAALKGLGVGFFAAPFASELYLHEYLAHQTYLLSKRAARTGWFLTRLTGLNPTTWSINHRVHHGPEQQEPLPPIKALLVAIKTGTVGIEAARAVTADPALGKVIIFPGRPVENDPILRHSETGGIEPRFPNRLDAWLAKRQVIDRIAGPAVLMACMGVSEYRKHKSFGRAVITAASAYAGYTLGMMGPGLVVSAYPERRTGFTEGSEAGIDSGPLAQILCGRFAMHKSHHEHPELAVPPGMVVDRDSLYARLLEVTGDGKEYDGTTG